MVGVATWVGLLVGTAALRVPLALELPGVGFALLASATAFEIILDIVFWVVVAAYLDAFEFRRAVELLTVLDVEPLLGTRFPLERIHDAFAAASSRRGVKTLVTP